LKNLIFYHVKTSERVTATTHLFDVHIPEGHAGEFVTNHVQPGEQVLDVYIFERQPNGDLIGVYSGGNWNVPNYYERAGVIGGREELFCKLAAADDFTSIPVISRETDVYTVAPQTVRLHKSRFAIGGKSVGYVPGNVWYHRCKRWAKLIGHFTEMAYGRDNATLVDAENYNDGIIALIKVRDVKTQLWCEMVLHIPSDSIGVVKLQNGSIVDGTFYTSVHEFNKKFKVDSDGVR